MAVLNKDKYAVLQLIVFINLSNKIPCLWYQPTTLGVTLNNKNNKKYILKRMNLLERDVC